MVATGIFDGRTALLVEDEPLIAMMIIDYLREMGFGVIIEARSAQFAFAHLMQATADVVLLDVHVEDGHTATIAGMLNARGIPFVFMTGDPAAARKIGFDVPVVSKPFSPAELHAGLAKAMSLEIG